MSGNLIFSDKSLANHFSFTPTSARSSAKRHSPSSEIVSASRSCAVKIKMTTARKVRGKIRLIKSTGLERNRTRPGANRNLLFGGAQQFRNQTFHRVRLRFERRLKFQGADGLARFRAD